MVRPKGKRVDPSRPSERGVTRIQYLVFVVLVAMACVATAILLWTRLTEDTGLAVPWFS
jgi:hypothetical protein